MAMYNEKLQALIKAYEKLKATPTSQMNEEQKLAHFNKLRDFSDQILEIKMESIHRLNELIQGQREGLERATDKLSPMSLGDSYPAIVDGLHKGAEIFESLMMF